MGVSDPTSPLFLHQFSRPESLSNARQRGAVGASGGAGRDTESRVGSKARKERSVDLARRFLDAGVVRTAITVPATVDFVDDLLDFRDVVSTELRHLHAQSNVDPERYALVQRWLTTHGMMSVAFRAQVAAITSVQWFRRLDATGRSEHIGIECPRDDSALDDQRVTEGYERLGLGATPIHEILTGGRRAAKEEDAFWQRMDALK